MKINDVLNEGLLDTFIAKYKSMTDTDPRLAALSPEEKFAHFVRQPQVQKLSDVARGQWEKQVMSVMQANSAAGRGLVIGTDEYTNRLKDFIEKIVINNRLDKLSQQDSDRVNAAMAKVINAYTDSDKEAMDQAFDQLIGVGAVARTSSGANRTSSTGQPSSTTSYTAGTAQRAVVDAFRQSGADASKIGTNIGAANQQNVRSTGNELADGVLIQMGFNI